MKSKSEKQDIRGGGKMGKVEPRPIEKEMSESYLDYAMSVIVSRALPDVRDGLKPVHRRILYAMWDMGLKSSAKLRKSATVVGEVLGKYHPHGDAAVYESMVRLAQDFSLRYPLVTGQGNWGSVDGDSAAAMRYTEAKLAPIAEEMLFDIDKNTVDFRPNYDNTHKEPQVLPSKLPNLLINGTLGIAVGMATNIPPHNLGELCDGIMYLIDNEDATIEDLMQFIKGPDFPTGGVIYNHQDIKQAYATGKGGIIMRAQTEIQENKDGQYSIIVAEIPFQVNKSTLIEKIADLVREKRLESIRGLRDESDKDGIRVVIDLKRDAYPQKVLNQLFKLTDLQTVFHVNMLALVDGIQPRVLTLKMVLDEYIKHRKEVIKRRTEFDLEKARDRAHILEGLKKALDNIDVVISTIKKSKDRDDAKVNLINKFKFTEKQAIAILEMRLQQLANLERIKIEDELREKKKLIKELEDILAHPKKILSIIKDELLALKQKYGGERRTKIIKGGVKEFSQEDLIPNEGTVIVITRDGYIKRLPPDTFRAQGRGGKGVIGLTTKEEDIVWGLIATTAHSNILFFTTRGRVFQLKAFDIPEAGRTAKGQALVNFLQTAGDEKVSATLAIGAGPSSQYLIMVTSKGVIKKVDIHSFENVRRSGLIACKLKGDDRLEWVKPTSGRDDIILVTSQGQSIRFKESNIRAMGRNAAGVRGIRLKKDDVIIGMAVIDTRAIKDLELLVVTEEGFGKRTPIKEYRVQGRGGSGIKTAKVTKKIGKIVTSMVVSKMLSEGVKGDLIVISEKGQVIRLSLKSVSVLGRATQGVRIMRFKEVGDKVASVTLV